MPMQICLNTVIRLLFVKNIIISDKASWYSLSHSLFICYPWYLPQQTKLRQNVRKNGFRGVFLLRIDVVRYKIILSS